MARPISFDPEEALACALELFWKRGYHTVSVEDIVKATGLNRHSLYNRFRSKFGLLEAALAHYRNLVLDHIRELLTDPDRTNRERIEALMALRESKNNENGVWHKMLNRGCFALRVAAELRDSHPELGKLIDDFGDTIEGLVAEVVRNGQREGEFRKDRTPEDLGAVLVGGFMLPIIYSPAAPRAGAFLAVLD